jgi:hypothetical protein
MEKPDHDVLHILDKKLDLAFMFCYSRMLLLLWLSLLLIYAAIILRVTTKIRGAGATTPKLKKKKR